MGKSATFPPLALILLLSGINANAAPLSPWEEIWVRQCQLDGGGNRGLGECDRQIDKWRKQARKTGRIGVPTSWLVRDQVCPGEQRFMNDQVQRVYDGLKPYKDTLTRDWLQIRDEQIEEQMRDYGLIYEYAEQRVDSIYLMFLLEPFCELHRAD